MAQASYKLLAGPVLRRTEPARACVWVATADPVTVKGSVFIATETLRQTSPKLIGYGERKSVKLGDKLYVTLVQILPLKNEGDQQATFGKSLYAYDLSFTFEDGTSKKLNDCFDNIWGEKGIAYKPYNLPTFFLKSSGQVNILHGSCRKLHGEGVDALAIADKIIQENINDLGARPNALFLTGDQIYADDVAEPLIGLITSLGTKLVGWDEELPASSGGRTLPLSRLQCGARGKLVTHKNTPDKKPMFTSTAARNHLLGFSDYAAMYLLAWNEENWIDLPKNSTCGDFKPGDYQGQLASLERARKTLANVRRVLANIPTYMIFDDHEITDDWNLTQNWKRNAEGDPLGRRVITNGLAAYWAFQAWGNDPDSFDEDFIRQVTTHVQTKGKSGTGDYESILLGFSKWSFVAPTYPKAIFLDSRTHRSFDKGKPDGPPHLLDDDELVELTIKIDAAKTSNDFLLIIAQTPVLGIARIEALQEWIGRKFTPTEYDLENWHANTRGYYDFLSTVQGENIRSCVILSGDVHYSFAERNKFKGSGSTTEFIQFNSSAFKNQVGGGGGMVIGGLANITEKKATISVYKKISERSAKELYVLKSDYPNPISLIFENFNQSYVAVPPEIAAKVHIKGKPDFTESLELLSTNENDKYLFIPNSCIGQLIIGDEKGSMIFHSSRGGRITRDEIKADMYI